MEFLANADYGSENDGEDDDGVTTTEKVESADNDEKMPGIEKSAASSGRPSSEKRSSTEPTSASDPKRVKLPPPNLSPPRSSHLQSVANTVHKPTATQRSSSNPPAPRTNSSSPSQALLPPQLRKGRPNIVTEDTKAMGFKPKSKRDVPR
uniref:Uncharacterized protein n=1 Tax=Cyanoptyche gloeocystis TaxID=77922 RepID=A0A7S2JJC0_9EUKA|mmetsp:Transcript_1019/g.1925  ORF Transcript_1019/g.1925 Transcript_1019/m.1925 type:complete len:150 (+) Transcript_1019:14-463(+)